MRSATTACDPRAGSRVPPALAVLALLPLAWSCREDEGDPLRDRCGDLRTATSEVVGGTAEHDPAVVDLSEGQVRAVGQILVYTEEYGVACTATLVGPDVLLTAAHCIPAETVAIEFLTGRDSADPVAVLDASSWEVHPMYDPGSGGAPDFDLAVIRLEGDPAAHGLEPVFVNDTFRIMLGETVQLVGYGATGVPEDDGLRWWTVQQIQIELPFAFSASDGGLSGMCHGDSGGPMLFTVPGAGPRVMGTAASISGSGPECLGASNYSRSSAAVDWLAERVPTGPCWSETLEGRCDGTTAIWCEDAEIHAVDCAPDGLECADGGEGLHRCVEPEPPCGGETEAGRCDGEEAVWCEDGEVVRRDCAAEGLACGEDGDGLSRCVEECVALGIEGECADGVARWCEDGRILERDCAACDQACDWSPAAGGWYCI